MPRYEVNLLGRRFEVEADDLGKAQGMARLHVARENMTGQATARAMESRKPEESRAVLRDVLSRAGSFGTGPTQEDIAAGREANIPALTMGALVAGPAIAGAVAAPAATATALGTGYLGSEAGGRVAGKAGRIAEGLGAPEGTAKVLRSGGEVLGGFAGGFGGVKALEGILSRFATPTERALLATVLKRAESSVAAKAAGTAEAAASPTILPAGQRAMPTNLGGAAKPGPAPTPPEKIEEALQATLDALKAKKPGVLQPERIQVGAQNVGRAVGLTKEQVRMEAGPVVGEQLGAASPVFPQKAFDAIYSKMRAMPRGGPERMAYAAAAKGEKAMSQVETIRRTLEAAGLIVPVAAIAEAVRRKEQGAER